MKLRGYSNCSDLGIGKDMKKVGLKMTEENLGLFCSLAVRGMAEGLKKIRHKIPFEYTADDAWESLRWIPDFSKLAAAYLVKFGRTTHYFLPEGAADFFIKSISKIPDNWREIVPETINLPPPEGCDVVPNWPGGIMIHFPLCEKRESLILFPKPKIYFPVEITDELHPMDATHLMGEQLFTEYSLAIRHGHCIDTMSRYGMEGADLKGIDATPEALPENQQELLKEMIPEARENAGDDDIGMLNESRKIAIGAFLYMYSFPELIRPAEIEDVKHLRHYHGKTNYVGTHEMIRESIRYGRVAHPRIAHPRVLRSEKFTRKRWQVVWVKACYVRGTANEIDMDKKESLSKVP